MARTAIVAQEFAADSSFTPTYEAANVDGDSIPYPKNGCLFIHAKNTNAAARTLTVKAGTDGDTGLAWRAGLGDLVVTLDATTGDEMIGPLDAARFKQNDGSVYVDYSAIANVTIAAFQIDRPLT